MRKLKVALFRTVTWVLRTLGYSLHRSTVPIVSFDVFTSIVRAYELCLNEIDPLIAENPTRAKLLARLLGTPPAEAYFIIQALARSRPIAGDVCEFGVAQGETSALIANEIAQGNKVLHLFDSFQGLPKPTDKDRLKDDIFSLGSMDAYAGTMACPEDMVRARLAAVDFPPQRCVIHRGFIEQVIEDAAHLPRQVSFAYVDFDLYEPIRRTLDVLHDRTPEGAIVIVDDYDWFSTGAKTAVDEFLEEKNSAARVYECVVPDTRYGYFAVLTKVA